MVCSYEERSIKKKPPPTIVSGVCLASAQLMRKKRIKTTLSTVSSIHTHNNRAYDPRTKEHNKKEYNDIPNRMYVVGHSIQIHGLWQAVLFQHFLL